MSKIPGIILAGFLWFSGLTVFFLWAVVIILVSVFSRGKVLEYCIKMACRSILFVLGIRVRVHDLAGINYRNQYIVMMNHVNTFDPFVFYARFRGKARGIEEEGHFHWPVYGWLLRRIGQIPISRKSGWQGLASLEKARELVRKNTDTSLIILPEGTRTRTGKLGPFKKGGFLLAIESGLDILPVVQRGSFKIKRKGSWIIKPGKIDYIIEPVISSRRITRENVRELMEETRQAFLRHVD